MVYEDGSVYDGEWKDGLRNGVGLMKYVDGSMYEGEWNNDVWSNFGVYRYYDNDLTTFINCEGEWIHDTLDGKVNIKSDDRSYSFEGYYQEGVWIRGDEVLKTTIREEFERVDNYIQNYVVIN